MTEWGLKKAGFFTFSGPRASRTAEVCKAGPLSAPVSGSPVVLRASSAGRQARCHLDMDALYFAGEWKVWYIQISLTWNYSSLHGFASSLLFRHLKKAVFSDGNSHIFQTRKLINGKFGLFLKVAFQLSSHKAKAKIFKAHVLDVFSLPWVCLLYCPCRLMALTLGALLSFLHLLFRKVCQWENCMD